MKNILLAFGLSILTTSAFAQSGTNSPYSQYGLGVLSDQGNSFNRGMNGTGIGLHEHNQINYLNPASYSSIDSLSFVFDMGASLQLTNFKENGVKKNAKNADFEYAVGGFRIMRHFGMAFGIIPYSNIGYNFTNSNTIKRNDTQTETTYTNTFAGSGGIHEVFLGLGWQPIKGVSLGANVGYLWGNSSRTITNAYSDNYVNTLTKSYSFDVSNYKLDLGAQFNFKVNSKDAVTIGVTYGLGHKLHADPTIEIISTNSQTAVTDTTSLTAKNGIELPHEYGAGFAYSHNDQLTVAFDYTLQKWSDVHYPIYTDLGNGNVSYKAVTNQFNDRKKYNFGLEYCKNKVGRTFGSRIRYRLGASYTSPYLKINGLDGPKEISVSGGFGIPIVNGFNNRSILNISAQWVKSSAKNMITENTFRINIGLTFNERWFAKWKFE